jgi:hypothetical protein
LQIKQYLDLLEEIKGKNIQIIIGKFQNLRQIIKIHYLKHYHKVRMTYEGLIQKLQHWVQSRLGTQ